MRGYEFMTLEESIKKTIDQCEKSLSKDELEKIESVSGLFEKLVASGLISGPEYNLAPITTMPIQLVNKIFY